MSGFVLKIMTVRKIDYLIKSSMHLMQDGSFTDCRSSQTH